MPPIASAIGWPLERLRGVAGRLARENAVRNPSRTAVTAAALMIGLALVTFVTVLAAGLRASINDTVDKNFAGDLVLQNKDGVLSDPGRGRARGRARSRRRRRLPLNASAGEGQGRLRRPRPWRASTRARSRRCGSPRSRRGPTNVLDTLGPRDAVLVDDWAKSNNFDVGDTAARSRPRPARRSCSRCAGRSTTRATSSATSTARHDDRAARLRPARRRRRPDQGRTRRRLEGGPGAGRQGARRAVPDRRVAEPAAVQGQHRGAR